MCFVASDSINSYMGIGTRDCKDWDGNIRATSRAVRDLLNKVIGSTRDQVMRAPTSEFTKPWNPNNNIEGPQVLHEYQRSGNQAAKIDMVLKKLEPRHNKYCA